MNMKAILLSTAALIAAGAFGYSVVSSSNATQFNPSNTQKSEIESIVKNYLIENPEVIIQALDAYSEREAERQAAMAGEKIQEHLPALLDEKDGYITGAKGADAKVVVIEMFDYHCGFCKRATDFMHDLIEKEDDVQVVFRELPVLREESFYAAEIALAARSQNKYRDLHFAMMDASGLLTEDKIDSIAKNAGLNLQTLHSTHQNISVEGTMDRTRKIAIDLGIDGTPAFIIATMDGSFTRMVPGWAPDEVEQAIKEARKAG